MPNAEHLPPLPPHWPYGAMVLLLLAAAAGAEGAELPLGATHWYQYWVERWHVKSPSQV
jgi:hypothetical protein